MRPTLEMLDLCYQCHVPSNRCSSDRFKIIPGVFHNMTNLVALKMSGLKIHRFYKDTLRGLSSLEEFHLDDSSISLIENGAFNHLPNLKWLDLSNNQDLSYLTTVTFHGLDNLEYLDMSYSSRSFINMVSPLRRQSADLYLLETLKKVMGIRVLLLKCALTERCVSQYEYDSPLQKTLLSQMPVLTVLDLSENSLTSWTDDRFEDNTLLEELYLENNSILFLTQGMIESFRRLKVLDLRDNAITCNNMIIDFYDMAEALKPNLRVKGWTSGEGYVCYTEDNLEAVTFRAYAEENRIADGGGSGDGGRRDGDPRLAVILTAVLSLLAVTVLVVLGVVYKNRFFIGYYYLKSRRKIHGARDPHTHYAFDVFISYAKEDSGFVHQDLVPQLEETHPKVRACVHERDFEPGKAVTENIVAGIDRSRKFLIVLSEAYVASKWCMFETHLAQERMAGLAKDNIVVVVKEMPERPNKTLRDILATWTYLERSPAAASEPVFYKRLKQSVSKTVC